MRVHQRLEPYVEGDGALRPLANRAHARTPNPSATFLYTGIEVEVENAREHPHGDADPWSVVGDGSLRNNGIELVSAPIYTTQTFRRYMNKYQQLRDEYEWEDNIRTSTHVHLDVRHLDLRRLTQILAAYCVVEPVLYAKAGPLREENIYCIPFYRADDFIESYISGLHNGGLVGTLNEACKYVGLFLGPLRSFGTIEFRMAPSYRTAAELEEWVNGLHMLYRGALGLQPGEAIALLDSGAYGELASRLLPDSWVSPLARNANEFADTIEDYGCDERALSLYELLAEPRAKKWDIPLAPSVDPASRTRRRGLSMSDIDRPMRINPEFLSRLNSQIRPATVDEDPAAAMRNRAQQARDEIRMRQMSTAELREQVAAARNRLAQEYGAMTYTAFGTGPTRRIDITAANVPTDAEMWIDEPRGDELDDEDDEEAEEF